MTAVPSIEDVVTRVPSWTGRPVRWQHVAGATSGRVFRVDVDGRTYVLRVLDPARAAAGLALPPDREIANTLTASADGVGARVYHVMDDVPALVLEFLPGRTLRNMEVRNAQVVPALALACRRLHRGMEFGNDVEAFARIDALLEACRRADRPLPEGYLERSEPLRKAREAFAVRPLPTVPCHNNLAAKSFMALADGIRIVDYQLSGNNDPAFDLGGVAAMAGYDPDRVEWLAAAYFGDEFDAALQARVELQSIVFGAFRALWLAVRAGLPDPPGNQRAEEGQGDPVLVDVWDRTRQELDGPRFARLLDAVAGRLPKVGLGG